MACIRGQCVMDDFAHGLNSMLRITPDFIVIGEIRNPATVEAVQRAVRRGKTYLTPPSGKRVRMYPRKSKGWRCHIRMIKAASGKVRQS